MYSMCEEHNCDRKILVFLILHIYDQSLVLSNEIKYFSLILIEYLIELPYKIMWLHNKPNDQDTYIAT